jgi:hypothetical protein
MLWIFQKVSDFFRKRKARAEIKRIRFDLEVITHRLDLEEDEKAILILQSYKKIRTLETEIFKVHRQLTLL